MFVTIYNGAYCFYFILILVLIIHILFYWAVVSSAPGAVVAPVTII